MSAGFLFVFAQIKIVVAAQGADSVGGRDVSGRGKSFFRGDLNRLDHRGGVFPPPFRG